METPTLICPGTGIKFQPRRTNQKFLNNKARNAFHNAIARKLRQRTAKKDKALKKNLKIILSLLGNENEVIKSKEFLLGAGFDFRGVNDVKRMGEIIVNCVYDVGFYKLSDSTYKLLKEC